jgi:hypothetical protein
LTVKTLVLVFINEGLSISYSMLLLAMWLDLAGCLD